MEEKTGKQGDAIRERHDYTDVGSLGKLQRTFHFWASLVCDFLQPTCNFLFFII